MEYIDIIYKLFLLLGLVCGGIVAFVKWLLQQRKQDEDISELQIKEKNDIASLKKQHNEDMNAVNDELTLLTYGVLACLKGLKEQGNHRFRSSICNSYCPSKHGLRCY